MLIWNSWQSAIDWLDENVTDTTWILCSDWIIGQVSILKYTDGNVWYFGSWLDRGWNT